MKTSVKKDTHTGEQPIRVLKHNLTTRLVERNEEYIKSLFSDFKLDKNIIYHVASLPLSSRQTPFIDSNGQINIHETFQSYIWIVTYYLFVLHEEMVAIPDLKRRNMPVHKNQNLALVNEAKELFNYGKSLVRGFSSWDKENLPNPEYFDENTEAGWYILRTNDLYVEVFNLILYHETAHAELEHIKQIKSRNLSNADRKLLELEADSRAIELLTSNRRNVKATDLSIIIALSSMLFFKNNLDGGSIHPNIDVRIENAVHLLKPDEESPVWAVLTIFLKVWSEQFLITLKEKQEYDSYKDLYYDYISQVR